MYSICLNLVLLNSLSQNTGLRKVPWAVVITPEYRLASLNIRNKDEEPIMPNFFHLLIQIFLFFATKLGHFIEDKIIFTCYKHSNFTARIGKQCKNYVWQDWLQLLLRITTHSTNLQLKEARYNAVKVGGGLFIVNTQPSKNKLVHLRNKIYLFSFAYFFLSDPALR